MKLLIIGAGPGGYETAIEAARKGLEVTLVTEGPLGGTCLNVGCIPTKTFKVAASLEEAISRKNKVVQQLRSDIESLLKSARVNVVYGHASFKDKNRIEVDGVEYSADYIIIATGSVPASLTIKGAELGKVITSDKILDLKEEPESLCIIGGGVIGLEFASIFNRFESEVTVLEYCDQVLPRFDKELAEQLKRSLSNQGIQIKTSYQVKDINEIDADIILMAVGRNVNVYGLNLEAAGIEYSNKGIKVDDNMQTSVEGVYAIGDVNGKMMLAHVATFQGKRALNHIIGLEDKIRFDLVPSVVFTTPEVATVGMTEEMCDDEELDYSVRKSFYRANGKAVSMNESEGFCKIIVDNETDKIIGAHIMGAHASDMIHELTVIINLGATLEDVKNVIHAHPTLSEVVEAAIQQ